MVWTKPDDFDFDAKHPLAGWGTLRAGGFSTLFGDGCVHFISNTIDPVVLRSRFTYAGREPVSVP
ncbi:MAG: hypothetical protein HY288_19515 [Planctomycetia bacterium]|nr:hypothetical protein [Planctomycetia bacterium]